MKRSYRYSTALLMILTVLFSSMPVMAENTNDITVLKDEVSSESSFVEETEEKLDVQSTIARCSEELEGLTPGEDYVENEAICSANSKEEAEKIADSYDASLSSWSDGIAVLEFDKDIKDALDEASESVSADRVIYPNYIVETADYEYEGSLLEEESVEDEVEATASVNDPKYSSQWHHSKINSASAWDVTSGNGVKVAVIDNGFYTSHEDLEDNVYECYNASDGTEDVSPISGDNKNHGTHVAGIIAAEMDNEKGGCGVAPSVSLCLIKAANSNDTMTIATLCKGLNKAVDWDVDVINLSLAATAPSLEGVKLMQDAIEAANDSGATVVCAAGNSGKDTESYPAACEGVIAVASITSAGALASSSNYGDWVDVAAPGQGIYSCYIDNSYGTMSGTSMASPMVTAVAALIYSKNPSLITANSSKAVEAVTQRILASTDGKTYSSSSGSVTGCIDAAAAVGAVTDTSQVSDPEFYVKTSSGLIKSGGSCWITPGKAIRLTIVDSNGKKIKGAMKKTASTFSSTNTSEFTMKKNKLKCLKTATSYTKSGGSYSDAAKTVVTVSYNNSVVKVKFVAAEKIKKGACSGDSGKKKIELSVSTGSSISLNSVASMCGEEVYYYGKGDSVVGSSYSMGYILSIPKKATKNSMITYDSDGNPVSFTPTKKGNYIFKVISPTGIKKKFKIKFKVS
ncbi:MAG: S8 family serine peptidase [Lachnospiraceae bacterium]|nr:S8 family serine peptidase [Lachnospiraceae bacterium]